MVFNAKFDAGLLEYDTKYDNSLDFSPTFQAYTEQLAQELCDRYQLRRKHIVGVGCGKGTFLKALCRYGPNLGCGYDPSFLGETDPTAGVKFVRGYFTRQEAEKGYDFLCCRHVLEHIEKPLDFIRQITSGEDNAGAMLYMEVPNGEYVLTGPGLWDVIYPHVSYFTEASLVMLMERAGLQVVRAGKRFFDQFLFVEARIPGARNSRKQRRTRLGSASHPSVGNLGVTVSNAVRSWSDAIAHLVAGKGRPLAFWGAGAKGVSFLNLVPGASQIPIVVDSNPRKQGMYVPGTGQLIVAPEELESLGTQSHYFAEFRLSGRDRKLPSCPRDVGSDIN